MSVPIDVVADPADNVPTNVCRSVPAPVVVPVPGKVTADIAGVKFAANVTDDAPEMGSVAALVSIIDPTAVEADPADKVPIAVTVIAPPFVAADAEETVCVTVGANDPAPVAA